MEIRELERMLEPLGNTFIESFSDKAISNGAKSFFYYGEEDRSFSYAEFNQLANSLANNLRAMGLGHGDRVSVFLLNPVVTVLSMFALWKIGAVFCPVNYNYKGRFLSYQINDTRPGLIITERRLVSEIYKIASDIQPVEIILHEPKTGDHDYLPDSETAGRNPGFKQIGFDELLTGDGSNPDIGIHPEDVASIIYTSGTTGNPKGVMQPHRYLHNYLFRGVLLGHPDDVIYNDLPLYHVGGAYYSIVKAAWIGCTVAVWNRFSPGQFWSRIRQSNATHCTLLDVMVPWLMQQEPRSDDRFNPLKTVHMQPLPENHHEVAKRFGIDFVSIGFGSTEGGSSFGGMIDELGEETGTPAELYRGISKTELRERCRKLNMPLVHGWEVVPKGYMGRPSILQEVRAVDGDGNPVPPGTPGQLVIRSRFPHMILKEYFNKPEATEAAMKDGWYYSGDMVVQNDDIFCFVDRIGGFIRSRGENLSSYQVEGALNTHPAIGNSAVFPIEAAEGNEEDIVAFIVLAQGAVLSETELRTWMTSEMPKYMIPRHVRFVEEFPVTQTYKVEKYKLKKMILKELGMISDNN